MRFSYKMKKDFIDIQHTFEKNKFTLDLIKENIEETYCMYTPLTFK